MAFLIPENAKSRKDIPNAHRQVMAALQVGLDDVAIAWYEPPYDPSGEKPHIVVLMPDMGIVVLEVLDIGTGGGLLGALRGKLRVERDGREVEIVSPLERAQKLAEVLRKRIAAEGRLAKFTIPVASGAVFPAYSRSAAEARNLATVLPLDLCLFRDVIDAAIDGDGEAGLLRAFQRMLGGRFEKRLDEQIEKILRGIIQPDTVIDRVASSSAGQQVVIFRAPEDAEDIIRVMDKKQEAMAKNLGDGHRVIRGVAGSGKTLILVYRAKLLSRLMPTSRILVSCYTRSLAGQLRVLLSEYGNVEVANLDKLMGEALLGAGIPHPGYRGDDAGDRVARLARDALVGVPKLRFRAILLDEAQDFSTDALRFTLSLLEDGAEDLVIVADAAQNIFRRKFSWKQAGIHAQGRTNILRVNYRNTREILGFASRFLLSSSTLHADDVPDSDDENAVIPPKAASRSGPSPIVKIGRSLADEINAAVELASKWASGSTQPRRVAVLYGSSRDGSEERAQVIHDHLIKHGARVFWMNDPTDRRAKDRLAEADESIILGTVHSAKGLEFPFVVLCGLWQDREDIDVNRKLAYVGMTRATNGLAVCTREGHPLVDDLRRAVGTA